MSARRSGPILLAALLSAAACKDVSQQAPPDTLVIAVFSSPNIPTPNDLVLQAVPTLPDSAQKNLLQSLVDQGGFPADQAPTLSIPLRAYAWNDATHAYEASADLPTLDPASVTSETAALYKVDVSPPTRVEVEAVATQRAGTAALVPVADDTGSRRLLPGRYVFAVRGGSHGLKTTTGLPIDADTAIALTIPNKDLSNPANQPPGGLDAAQVAQLGAVQGVLWNPLTWGPVNIAGTNYWTASPSADVTPAYAAVDAAFPHEQVASIAAFQIAPRAGETFAAVDSTSGEAPLPLDLLRTGEDGTIAFNAAFGPAAEGLTTLDGFSTTAMLLAPVITPGSAVSAIDASTVYGATVFLYELGGATPVLLPELKHELFKGLAGDPASARYVAQPTPIIVPQGASCPIVGGCSPVIGLQPAVNTGLGLYLPPLKESTTYAVVITNGVRDLAGAPLARSSVMPLLLDPNPLVHPVTGASLVGGVDDTTAGALQRMNDELEPVLEALPDGTTVDDVSLAYTFRTQSITPTALSIAALPYQAGAGTVLSATFLTPAQAAAQYGLSAANLPTPPVAEVAEVRLATVSLLLGSENGAFNPDLPTPEPITALVAIPSAAAVTGACPPGIDAAACAPLVVYRHGITRSKADVLAVAAALTAQGFVVAAIDGEKHGDRSWCTSDDQCCPAALCGAASTCAFKDNFTSPTDGTTQIGVCESAPDVRGSYLNMRVDCAEPFLADGVSPNPACLSPKGIPYVSANYLVSLNFFRTRDTLRQDIIDQSSLVKALAPTATSADAFATHLAASDIAVDYTKVYLLSHSLGAIQGAVDVAVNPRFSHSVFAAPGATVVDIFANPASDYHAALVELLDPIQENSAEYLQLLQVAKWILDPAEPANFAKHVNLERLVSPLNAAGFANQSRAGQLLVENALCDNVIPNTQNAYFASQLGLSVPTPGAASSGYVQWYVNSAATQTCPADAATHSFLFDGADLSLTTQAQVTAASFLASPATQPATVRPQP